MSTQVTEWPATLRACATQPVLDASERYAESVEKLRSGEVDLTKARQAVEQAIHNDDAATLRATEQGKPAPKATVPKAAEAVTGAERTVAALRQLHDIATAEYLAAVRDDHKELREKTAAALSAELAGINAAINHIAEQLVGVADLRVLAEQLGPDTSELQGRTIVFRPARTGRLLERDPLPFKLREMLIALQAEVREQSDYMTVSF